MGVCASAPAEGSLAAGKVQKVGVPRHGRDESYGGGSVRRGPEEETVRGGKQWYQVRRAGAAAGGSRGGGLALRPQPTQQTSRVARPQPPAQHGRQPMQARRAGAGGL